VIKIPVEYEDFEENQVKEDLYFHMSKMELIDMELSHEGGLSTILPEMLQKKDLGEIIRLFRLVIKRAYGKKSEDGRRFEKSDEDAEQFMNSPAFDALFTKMVSDPEQFTKFITGLIPKDMLEAVEAETQNQLSLTGSTPPPAKPWIAEDRDPTQQELTSMSHDDLLEVMKRKVSGGSTTVPSQPKQVL
jgi:hypothetical protein